MNSSICFVVLILLILTASPFAQPHSLTWRGAPLDKTKSFLITECAVSYRLFRHPDYLFDDNQNIHVQWEIGWMKNSSQHWAFGATAYVGADDDASIFAIKPRARRWLSPNTALDFSAGPSVLTLGDYREYAPGLVAGISLMKGDLFGVSVTYQLTPYRYFITSPSDDPFEAKGTRHELYAGARFGSYAGTAVGIAIPVGVVLWLLANADD
jgi:hypothetical protein